MRLAAHDEERFVPRRLHAAWASASAWAGHSLVLVLASASACVSVPAAEPVAFAIDDDQLRDARAERELERAVAALRDDGELHLLIIGHADEDNTDDYNRELSRRRAEHVRARVLALAPELSDRITIEARGEWDASEQGDDEATKARNRRVELRFHYPRTCAPSFDTAFLACEWARLPEPAVAATPASAPKPEPAPAPAPEPPAPSPRSRQDFRGPFVFALGGYAITSSLYLRQAARWGVGAGYLWGFENEFRVALGLEFDHLVDLGFVFPQSGPCAPNCDDVDRTAVRVVPQLRLGGTKGGLWGWLRLSAGLVVQHHEAEFGEMPRDAGWDPGAVFGIGPGFAITLTAHLLLLFDATITYAVLPGIDGGGGGAGIYDVGTGLGWVF